MQLIQSSSSKAPLLSWDIMTAKYNALMEDAEKYQQSLLAIKQIARNNKWDKQQLEEAITKLQQYVVIITDPHQQISFTGKGFYEMTGYTYDEAKGRNPKFLQGPATNRNSTGQVKEQLKQNETIEVILENYRKDGKPYLCKIIIKSIVNINHKLVNFIAYEQEIAA